MVAAFDLMTQRWALAVKSDRVEGVTFVPGLRFRETSPIAARMKAVRVRKGMKGVKDPVLRLCSGQVLSQKTHTLMQKKSRPRRSGFMYFL
jgi:hypothetical protein